MNIKRIITTTLSFTLLLPLCAGLSGCASPGDDTDTTLPESTPPATTDTQSSPQTDQPVLTERVYSFKDVQEQIKLLGRTTTISSGIACDQSASGMEFTVFAAGNVTLSISSLGASGGMAESYFTVYVDAIRRETRYKVRGMGKIVIEDLPEGEHTIRIVKQTEAANSLCVFKKLTLTGQLRERPADRGLYIEILGDSVTAAYGNLVEGNNYTNPSNTNGASAEYQDSTLAFPYLTAEKLNADLSLLGYSGIGLTPCAPPFTIGEYYTRTSYLRSDKTLYDFETARVPDLIVMDLAQNDFNTSKGSTVVVREARKLIEEVRRLWGKDVPIVWTHDMNGDCYSSDIQKLIKDMGGAQSGLYTLRLPSNFGGANGHPTAAAHEASAKVLADFIREVLDIE